MITFSDSKSIMKDIHKLAFQLTKSNHNNWLIVVINSFKVADSDQITSWPMCRHD